jgi:hypothetical protein
MPPIDIKKAAVGTPEWFLGRLYAKLLERRPGLERLDRYYEGNQPLKFAADRFRKAFGKQFIPFSENVCPLVVDTLEQRLDVIGFRITSGRKTLQGKAWDIWQENQMDSESEIAHSEALTLGLSYGLVWNTDESDTEPVITIESAHEMIIEHLPGSRWGRAAALKAWRDEWTGLMHATLYLPDEVWKYQSTQKIDEKASLTTSEVTWEAREVEGETWPLSNRLGVVPVVPLYNRPRLRRPPRSEIMDVIPSQDAINKLTADMLVASEFAAFRQRVLIGVDEPKDPETGQVVKDYWKQALESFLILPNENAKATSIEATDLNNYVNAIEHEIQKVATRTQTPPHIFFLRGQFPSGESIVAAESGLVKKAFRRMRHFEDAWEEIVQLALAVTGAKVPLTSISTLWEDPESRTEAQHIDAVGKKRQMLEVPLEQAWEDAGYTPPQIERMNKLRAAELAAAPAPQPVPPPAMGTPPV